jgi:hypothetical protein
MPLPSNITLHVKAHLFFFAFQLLNDFTQGKIVTPKRNKDKNVLPALISTSNDKQ